MVKLKANKKLSSALTGIAGVYLVAAELTRRGYIASITLRNTKGIDILVSNAHSSKSAGIQVKTTRKGRKWLLGQKDEEYFADGLYYVFVNMNDGHEHPDFHIVPSGVVAGYIKRNHADWLRRPGKKGQKHNDSTMRVFNDKQNEYRGKWNILRLE